MKRLAFLLCLVSLPMMASTKIKMPCTSYLLLIEQDEETVNMKMTGANKPQADWFRKDGDGKDFAGVCLISADPSGKRVALDENNDASEKYLASLTEGTPVFLLSWEEHRIFVPDNKGGHYAYSANGAMFRTHADGNMTPIGPVHDTNRTIFSSSSLSLLKAAIKMVRQQ